MASVPKSSINAERQALYGRMDKHNLAPLWEVLHNLIPNEPSTPCKPALWKYRDARPYLMEAGKLITAKEAVRRVLILENPATADPREQAAAIRKAREAALADPEGQALGKTLGKPVVWLKPVKSAVSGKTTHG
jgi:gentisate 1,2-dioxygenase